MSSRFQRPSVEVLSLWSGNANVASQIETKILCVDEKHAVARHNI